MLATYKKVINCGLPLEILQIIMEDAVDRYLSLNPTVFPINRQDLSIEFKVQKNYRSSGEILTVSIWKGSFYITSKCVDEPYQLVAWGKNRDNVLTLSASITNAMQELYYDAA